MKFQRKLLLGFALMVLPVLLVGAQAVWNNREERAALRALGDSMARTRTYAELETVLFRQSRQVWGFLTGTDQEAQAEFFRLEPEIAERLGRWKQTLASDEMDLATDVEQLHAQMFDVGSRIISLYQGGQRSAALALANTELKGRLLPALSAKNKEVYGAARAHPGAPCCPVFIVDHSGGQAERLTRRPDAGDLGLGVGGTAEDVLGDMRGLLPDLGGVPNLDSVVVDPEVDRMGRLPPTITRS